jgi:transposase
VVAERAPQATLCLDPFHVVAWATKALDAVRRDLWNELRAEATNVHLRVLTRRAYGFHTPDALIAMAMLTRGGLCPDLPGRT